MVKNLYFGLGAKLSCLPCGDSKGRKVSHAVVTSRAIGSAFG